MPNCRDSGCRHYHLSAEAGQWVRVCTPRDVCPLDFIKLPSLAYRLQRVKEALARHGDRDPGLVVYMMRDWPEIAQTDLSDLAWAMHKDGSVHKNDVVFLIECLEKKWSERQLARSQP